MTTPPRVSIRALASNLLLSTILAVMVAAQSNRSNPTPNQTKPPAQTDWAKIDGELKVMLNEYYAGKPVRAKVVIPSNKQGLEIVDGVLRISPVSDLRLAVQPGELLLIKEMKFKSKSIEISFDSSYDNEPAPVPPSNLSITPVGTFGSEATDASNSGDKTPALNQPQAGTRLAPTNSPKLQIEPRITIKFSREITTRDLNLQSINRLLSVAVDTTSLAPTPDPGPRTNATEASPASATRPDATTLAERAAAAQGIRKAAITGDIITPQPNV
ncbi:MAG TPA: hypothetical protein VEF04_13080, partial [Blastocatellia bacterium]|nr:hypothetical protein [Blastocatellia bacterium]